MKINKTSNVIAMVLLLCALLLSSLAAQDLPRLSPGASVSQTVGLTDISVTYSRPGVKERTIWGGLVPYNKMWRTGANEATKITFSDDVKINGQALPAGSYSLFTIPGESGWTVIFNKNTELAGTNGYDEKEDALRIQVKPQAAEFVERMEFVFTDLKDNSTTVALHWEKLMVPFTVEVDVHSRAVENIQKAMAEAKPDDYLTPFRSANYYFNSDTDLEQALEWINKSVSIKETYFNTSVQARLYGKLGKYKEAIAAAEKSIQLRKADDSDADTSEMEKMIGEWKSMM
jgi:hypothetical protein